jgi:arylsulfatase A-like enzyme
VGADAHQGPRADQGRVDDRNWEHVDLLPTIADTVGLSIPWKVDGLAQTGPPGRQSTDKTFYNHPASRCTGPGRPTSPPCCTG